MRWYRPEEIIGEADDIEVLQNPESQNFAPNAVESLRDSEHVEVREPNGFYDLIAVDRLNQNISFSFNDRDTAADFYRAVEFDEDYTLIESITNRNPGASRIDTNFSNGDGVTVLHYLATDEGENYLFENGEYRRFPNDSAHRIHNKSHKLLEERPFSERLLEPADE